MCLILLSASAVLASSDSWDRDASQWTTDDVYRILHDSPWTKTVKVSHSERNLASDNGPPPAGPSNTGRAAGSMPGRMGGMGRRGGGAVTTGGSNQGSGNASKTSSSSTAEVTIQWQSALPIRLATARDAGQDLRAVTTQPSNEYVIGVIGVRLSDFGGPVASLDSSTITDEGKEALKNRLKNAASLVRSGHDPLVPSSVDLDHGKDGRVVFHFPKSDPIMSKDKAVEFQISTAGKKIQKKFLLKDMEYADHLAL